MLTRATRSLAPAHAACARSMHSAARLLAEATPAAASAAAAAMPNLTAEATAAGFPRRLIRLADDVAAHRRPTQTEDGKWRKAKVRLIRRCALAASRLCFAAALLRCAHAARMQRDVIIHVLWRVEERLLTAPDSAIATVALQQTGVCRSFFPFFSQTFPKHSLPLHSTSRHPF